MDRNILKKLEVASTLEKKVCLPLTLKLYQEVERFPTSQQQDLLSSCQVIYSQFGLAIHQNDHQARLRFVEWAQNEIAVVPDFHKRILFSDEAHFWLNGYVNKQNCRIWSEANHKAMITNSFIPELNNPDVQELWFQQDGATCHTARATIDLLKDTFGDRLISRFGPMNWPPRSCDLTPLDYFLWGYVMSLVYVDKPQTLDHLEDNIRRVIADIRPQMLEKVIENWTSRLDYIRASRGSPMPEIIFKIKTKDIGDRLRNSEHGRETKMTLLLTNTNGRTLSFDRFNVHPPSLHSRASTTSGLETSTLRLKVRDPNH
ncbi:transposable element Tc3 transposase [Trichonephila clavipes]|nr:transposable element Tc3 transposase [Trichonephila clavipes]